MEEKTEKCLSVKEQMHGKMRGYESSNMQRNKY